MIAQERLPWGHSLLPSQRLVVAILDQEPPPCERGCKFYQHCATKVRACEAFREYVRTGAQLPPPADESAITLSAITDMDT